MLTPKAFSSRSAISGESDARPLRRSDSVARRTLRILAAWDTLSPQILNHLFAYEFPRVRTVIVLQIKAAHDTVCFVEGKLRFT